VAGDDPIEGCITAGYGLQLNPSGWVAMNDSRWISGDGLWEMDDNQASFQYAGIEIMQSYTLPEITYFHLTLSIYYQGQI